MADRPRDDAKVPKRKSARARGKADSSPEEGYSLRARKAATVVTPPKEPEPHRRRRGVHPIREPATSRGGNVKPRNAQSGGHRYRTPQQRNRILRLTKGFRTTIEGIYQQISDIRSGNWHEENAGKVRLNKKLASLKDQDYN